MTQRQRWNAAAKRYRERHPERVAAYQRAYRDARGEEFRRWDAARNRAALKTLPRFYLLKLLAMKGNTKPTEADINRQRESVVATRAKRSALAAQQNIQTLHLCALLTRQ